MDEFEIIRRFFTPDKASDSVVAGVGDDGAVLRPEPGRELVVVVDTMVEGVHYPARLSAEDIGYRSVAVNVSDIAAMGGRPRWMTIALTLSDATPDWLSSFSCGVRIAADKYGIELVGGDMTRGSEIVISVQIVGDVEAGRAITRKGASPGDAVYVSGYPGEAAAGLSIIQSTPSAGSLWATAEHLIRRFASPDARVELGQALTPLASAAIDVSDGLFSDLQKLVNASSVSAVVEVSDIPLSKELLETMDESDALRFALAGGDDYELCFTADDDAVIEAGEAIGVPVTKIGQVSDGRGVSCTRHGEPFEFVDDGYRHFR